MGLGGIEILYGLILPTSLQVKLVIHGAAPCFSMAVGLMAQEI